MDIIFWLNTPPVACRGVFNEVSRLWKGKTYYVCAEKMSEERIMTQHGENDYAEAEYLEIDPTVEDYVDQFIKTHIDDFHVFNGYKGATSKYIDQIYLKNKNAKIIIWAERPAYKGAGIKKLLLSIPYTLSHIKYTYKYKNKTKAFLPLGTAGVNAYRRLGWPQEKLFPFMYLPVMQENLPKCDFNVENTPRFVYVGRFRKMWKGIGVLTKACDMLANENFSIDFVGGYGENKDEVIEWINRTPQATFQGTWPINELCSNLQEYDICVVPSSFEGWNVTVNQAIMAGIGCICTDQAVSNELIENSKSGCVIKAKSPSELAKAMKMAIENPNLFREWKEKAYSYRSRITSRICAEYFINILRFVNGEGDRPLPPWVR